MNKGEMQVNDYGAIPDYEDYLQEQRQPIIEDGEYLAKIINAEELEGRADPTKINVRWSFVVNGSDYLEEWDDDPGTPTHIIDRYTPFCEIDEQGNRRARRSRAGKNIMDMTLSVARAADCLVNRDGMFYIDYDAARDAMVKVRIRNVEDNYRGDNSVRAEIASVSPFKPSQE